MEPLIPDYDGACLSNVVPTLLEPPAERPAWLPAAAWDAPQVVLLAVDGLGWDQLESRRHLTPTLSAMAGGPISTVAPSTTATALSSLTLGCPPGEHGVVGYRINVRGDVLNVLRWQTPAGDARTVIPPDVIQGRPAFRGRRPPIVTRAEFAGTGFSAAHLGDTRFHGWRVPSTLVTEVRNLLRAGERFVYAYYDGIDKVAHEYGLDDHYEAELVATDRLAADLIAVLPPGAVLVLTSDHGQVQVGDAIVPIHDDVMAHVELLSGEGRFRWLHARPGAHDDLAAAARACHDGRAWVRTRDEVVAEEWFGPKVSEAAAARFGDVVLAAIDPVAFEDPADTGPYRLQSRHGSLTPAEMRIPLLALGA
ncbi:MAG: putative Type phosphodiesterase/nucleotide pyrophosphatase [Actinomycetia bacterium]|nr:putative Type phosphodiesterase/nucleotide pyrophosphatase [Actinomycetes bacterium]